jgi:hypothetical protein
MGRRHLGRSAGRGRVLLGVAAALAAVVVLGAGPAAWADSPTPTPAPSPATSPAPSPAPSVSVSPPSQQQIDDARDALERLQEQGVGSTAPALAQVAGPETGHEDGSVASRMNDGAWWTLGAALLVLVVASEATRLGVRRARHRG